MAMCTDSVIMASTIAKHGVTYGDILAYAQDWQCTAEEVIKRIYESLLVTLAA